MKLSDEAVQSYLNGLNPALPDWMLEIRQSGKDEKVPIVRDDVGTFLRMFCGLQRPRTILEIGCGISYSTHWMLLGAPNAEVNAIDMNEYRIGLCRGFLKMSGFDKQVTLFQGWASEFFENRPDQKFDLIFVDSTKKGYQNLLEPCCDALNPGGSMIVDNILFGGKTIHLMPEQEKKYRNGVEALRAFNQSVASHPRLDCAFLPMSDGILLARKKP